MKIGIILDNPKREIDGTLLIVYHLVRNGHEAFIIPMYQQGHDLPLLGLDGIVVNYARSSNLSFLRAAKELGLTVFVLDNEGGVLVEKNTKTPSNPSAIRSTGVHAYIDHYMFWGRRQHDAFAQNGMFPDDRLHITGCPRYDVCSPRWRGLLEYPRCGYVLVNTNFCAINPLYTKTAQNERAAFLSVGWDSSYVEWLFDELRKTLSGYLETIAQLAQKHRDRFFVIRPHPFEDPDIYEKTYAGLTNVKVDSTGSVVNAIHNSTCVLHLNCQTAVETLLLDKLPVSMEFLNSEALRNHYPLPSQISYRARSNEELDSIIRNPDAYRSVYPSDSYYKEHIEPLFHLNDGDAARRAVDVLLAHTKIAPARNLARGYRLSIDACLDRPKIQQWLQGLLTNVVGSLIVSRLRNRFNPVRQTKYISVGLTESMLSKIAHHDGSGAAFRVSHARGAGLGLPLATLRIVAM